MKILHYFLGFPPYRSGGLTKYALDLMLAQSKDGNEVDALWPGRINLLNKMTRIKKNRSNNGIGNYELINPLPVPLDEGIIRVDAFTELCDIKIYTDYLRKINPQVVHIHTLMGLHKEFIDAANLLGIRTIFTTHDYFGICPKVTLYRNGVCCESDNNCEDCVSCNNSALSIKKIWIMQSPLYRYVKNSIIVKQLRRKHRMNFFLRESVHNLDDDDKVKPFSENYRSLRKYYIYMLENMSFIHFNSSVSDKIYRKYITPKCGTVLSITHEGISDNRLKVEKVYSDKIRFTLLAPAKPYKGFTLLKMVLDELWDDGERNFTLKVFSQVQYPSQYMDVRENGFKYSELPLIFSQTDVLIAPSIWYETFGFTVLEAVSYGVPVLVSDHVGAKDVIGGYGRVFKAGDSMELKIEIINILKNGELLCIKENTNLHVKSWTEFLNENYLIYDSAYDKR